MVLTHSWGIAIGRCQRPHAVQHQACHAIIETHHIIGPTSTSTSPISRSPFRTVDASTDRGRPDAILIVGQDTMISGRRAVAHLPYPDPGIDRLTEQQQSDTRAPPKEVRYERSPYPLCGSLGSAASITGSWPPKTVRTMLPPALSTSSSAGVGSHALENGMPSTHTASSTQRPLASASQWCLEHVVIPAILVRFVRHIQSCMSPRSYASENSESFVVVGERNAAYVAQTQPSLESGRCKLSADTPVPVRSSAKSWHGQDRS
jgi:hypothetical protein